jgi:ribosomal subunit interface protein
MDVPLEITFHNLTSSKALEGVIRDRVARLERFYDRMTSCRVAVEAPHRQHRKGNVFEIHIDIGLPGGSLAVSREPHKARERSTHPNIYKAMRDAFDAAERRLRDFKSRQRGEGRAPVMALLGAVAELNDGEDHGFLTTATGTSLYFHRDGVADGVLRELKPGTTVHYTETMGDTGPIATKVWVAVSSG